MNSTNDKILQLRNAMKAAGFDAVILPSNDPHQSEYVSDYWKIRAYFSGFTGSAGTLVVTENEAALWTDSRYFLQVETECKDTVVSLHRQSIPHAPEHIPWLIETLPNGATIAVDYRLSSLNQMESITSQAQGKNIQVTDLGDLVDDVWKNRPAQPNGPVEDHAYSGYPRKNKLERIVEDLKQKNADYSFISGLDEICWLFNLRSNDVDYTPLVLSYALVGRENACLFVEEGRVSEELKQVLFEDNILLFEYDELRDKLQSFTQGKRVIINPDTINYACYAAIAGEMISESSLIHKLKASKNLTERDNAKSAMIRDGVALTRFFIWLENYLKENTISEYELGRKLESFRQEQELYRGESFGCIVGYKENGAIIHYSAPETGSSIISNDGMLLIDSGAQYEDATTDITRTLWLGGNPTDEEKEAYTLVLKGFIELHSLQFPSGTSGIQLDAIARMHLWNHGLNYGHGTGHGIGSYSMVHEYGQGFASSTATPRGETPHQEDQFTTIEPGYYKEGAFGIRIENVVLSHENEIRNGRIFLAFEALTLCPIETTLIDRKLMLPHEINWLNSYHEKVYDTLSQHLSEEECVWLKEKCQLI